MRNGGKLYVKDGTADLNDTSRYSERLSKLLGEIMQENVGKITNPLGKEYVCKELLRDHYEAINDVLGAVQMSLDAELGIHLNPVKAPRNDERIAQVAHALEDPTVKPETIRRRAKAPVVNTAMSMHDSCIKINARKRNDLGFKCYLTRVAVGGCCKWCTEVAGRYVYGDHPEDIFRRHDNCDCTVTFENGRQRQDVWSKRTWDANDPEEVMQNASEPTVLSQDAAESLQNAALGRLTLAGERDIMRVADSGSIYHKITDESIQKVPLVDMFGDEEKNKRYQEANKALLREAQKHKPGVEVSIVYDTDMKPIKGYGYVVGEVGHVTIQNPGISFHAFHNHGSGETLSYSDIRCIVNNSSCLSITATGNTGKVYSLMKTEQSDSFGYGCFLRNKSKNVIFSAGESDFTLEKIADEETRKELMLIADKLQPEQKTALADAILSQTEKCLKGGAKYGYKYSENTP